MSAIDELRNAGLALLIVDCPPPRYRNEDGSPMVLASDEDHVYDVLEWCTMNRVGVTRDASEQADCVLAVLTPDWQKSPPATQAQPTDPRGHGLSIVAMLAPGSSNRNSAWHRESRVRLKSAKIHLILLKAGAIKVSTLRQPQTKDS